MSPKAVQTAGPIGLNFFVDIRMWPVLRGKNRFSLKFFSSKYQNKKILIKSLMQLLLLGKEEKSLVKIFHIL